MAHLQRLERLSAPDNAYQNELQQLLHRLRWRLGLERLALFAIRGCIGCAVALVVLSIALWLSAGDTKLLWLGATPLAAAVVFGLVRWPTRHETAVVVDQRYRLAERLTTAVELAEGSRRSRFLALQLRDTLEAAATLRGRWLALDVHARNQALIAAGALAVAVATLLVLARIPPPTLVVAAPAAAQDVADVPPVADELAQRALPLDAPNEALATPLPVQTAASPADLATRVQQEQAERSALDKLAQALGTISAGQPAADAIQQNDFTGARDQLQNLADNADQLSDAAKQQLAHGLQQAAAATTQTDAALAQREQQASQALARSTYDEQRQTLRGLADQVDRSSARSVPADQLERDVGQLQQQTAANAPTGATSSPSTRVGGQPAASAASTGQSNQPSGGQTAAGAAASGQNGNGQGNQPGPGVGTGSDPNLYSDQPSRLDTSGQQVQVPLKLGSGPGVRPADGSEDQANPDPRLSGRTTAELAQTQQTGQVAPEQNLVPGEQRPVVRGYFR
ncbi:MAG: hypothetical protein JO020_18085 [Chloroflexi bacterium]|nr:hypothetical protein [Chloroflexota bacterium]